MEDFSLKDLPDYDPDHAAVEAPESPSLFGVAEEEQARFSMGRAMRGALAEIKAWPGRVARGRKGYYEFGLDTTEMTESQINNVLANRDAIELSRIGQRIEELESEGYSNDEAIRRAKVENIDKMREEKIQFYDAVASDPRFQLPEAFRGRTSGYMESAIRGLAGSLPDIALLFLAPPMGVVAMWEHARGAKLEEFEVSKPPITRKRQYEIATGFAAAETGLELIGNMLQIKAVMGSLAAAMERSAYRKAMLDLVEAQIGEGLTEFFQQYPDEFTSIMALNPSLSKEELAEFIRMKMPEIHKGAIDAGIVGAMAGSILPGTSITVSLPIHALVSAKQKLIAKEQLKEQEIEERLQEAEEPTRIPEFGSTEEATEFGEMHYGNRVVLNELEARVMEHREKAGQFREEGEYNLGIIEATRSQFYREALEAAKEKSERIESQRVAKPQAGTAAGALTDDMELNEETLGGILDRIEIADDELINELKTIYEQRGEATYIDWMNPGKIYARLMARKKGEGIALNEAREELAPIIAKYNQDYHIVLQENRVQQKPIGYYRNQVLQGLRNTQRFLEPQINAYMDIFDAIARSWGERKGLDPRTWWDRWLIGFEQMKYNEFLERYRQDPEALDPMVFAQGKRSIPDLMWNGKPIKELTPDEFRQMGDEYGVTNLGPVSIIEEVKDRATGEIVGLPGGVSGEFTFLDLLWLKANPIDLSKLDKELKVQIWQKLGRSMSPRAQDELEVFNRFLFGFISNQAQLTHNEFAYSVLRARNRDEIKQLANYASDFRQNPTKENRRKIDEQIRRDFGIQAKAKGGIGLGIPQDLVTVAEFARLYLKNPSWFVKRPEEPWIGYAERIASQIPGIGIKTAGFGGEWMDPVGAWFATIDVHMARDVYEAIWPTKKERQKWESKWKAKWNKQVEKGQLAAGNKKVRKFAYIWNQPGGKNWIAREAVARRLEARKIKWKTADGRINPALPDYMKKVEWIEEPQDNMVKLASETYLRAVDVLEKRLADEGIDLALSPFQWMEWDAIRGHLEPHEIMFPGYYRLPKMSPQQLRAAFDAHVRAGYQGRPEIIPTEDLRDLIYFQDPVQMPRGLRFAPVAPEDVKSDLMLALRRMHSLELKYRAYDYAPIKDDMWKFYKQETEEELDELSGAIVDAVIDTYDEWLLRHDTGRGWVEQLFDTTGEQGLYAQPSDAFTDGRVGVIDMVSWRVDVEQEIVDRLQEKFGVLQRPKDPQEFIKALEEDYGQIIDDDLRQAVLDDEIEDYELDDMWKEALIESGEEGIYVESGLDVGELLNGYGWQSDIGREVQDVLATDGWLAWRDNWPGELDAAEERIRKSRQRLEEASTINEKMVAINLALQEQHVYGMMADHMGITDQELTELSRMGDEIKDFRDLLGKKIYYQDIPGDPNPYPFYSSLQKAVVKTLPGAGSPQQFVELFNSDKWRQKNQVKLEEVEYSGIVQWLEAQESIKQETIAEFEQRLEIARKHWQEHPTWESAKKTYNLIKDELDSWKAFKNRITKQEVIDFLNMTQIEIEEIWKGTNPSAVADWLADYDISMSEDYEDYYDVTPRRVEKPWEDVIQDYRGIGTIQLQELIESGRLYQEIAEEHPEVFNLIEDQGPEWENLIRDLDAQVASDEAYRDSIAQGESYPGSLGYGPYITQPDYVVRTPIGTYRMNLVGRTSANRDIVDIFFKEEPIGLMIGDEIEERHLGRVEPPPHETAWEVAEEKIAEHFNDNLPASARPQTTKYSDPRYVTEGGQGYVELLLRLPEGGRPAMQRSRNMAARINAMMGSNRWREEDLPENVRAEWIRVRDAAREEELRLVGSQFVSPHWEEENVLCHVRGAFYTDIDGKRTFLIDELQSDWIQKGKVEGFRTKPSAYRYEVSQQAPDRLPPRMTEAWEVRLYNLAGRQISRLAGYRTQEEAEQVGQNRVSKLGVPDAPFKNTWPLLAFKHIMKYAKENGAEQIAWTPAVTQINRWSHHLRQQVDEIRWEKKEARKPKWWPEERPWPPVQPPSPVQTFGLSVIPWEQWNRHYALEKGFALKVRKEPTRLEEEVLERKLSAQGASDEQILDILGKQRLSRGWLIIDENGDILAEDSNPEYLRAEIDSLRDNVLLTVHKDESTVLQELIATEGETEIQGRRVTLDTLLPGMANRIRQSPERAGVFTGDDLTIGGAIYHWVYEDTLPQLVKKYTKAKIVETSVGPNLRVEPIEEHRYGGRLARDYPWVTVLTKEDGAEEAYSFHDTKEKAEEYRQQKLKESRVYAVPMTEKMKDMVERGQPYFQDKKRGAVQFLQEKGPAIITAFEAADATTPIHEVGHILLEMLREQGDADWLTVAEWLGADPNEALSKEQHENFSRGWERYIMEGKAPTARLKVAFQNLREWMLRIYRTLIRPKVALTDEVREVFDRMLTTEEERQQEPFLDDVEEWLNVEDISEPIPIYEGDDYERIEAEARRRAIEKVKKRSADREKKNRRAFAKQAEETIKEIPIYQLMADVVERGGFSMEKALKDYSREDIADWNKLRPGLFTKKGTLALDEIADEYGYEYDTDLVEEIRNTVPMKEQIEREVDNLLAEYADYIEDFDSQVQVQFYEEEAKILARMTGKYRPQPTKKIKKLIRAKTGQLRVNELEATISSKQALQTMMKRLQVETRNAYREGAKDKALELAEKKRIVALQQRERARAKKQMRKYVDFLKKAHKTKGIPYDYSQRIIDILSPFDLTAMSTQKRASLEQTRQWLEQQEEQGNDVQLPKAKLDQIARLDLKSYKDMDLEELEALHDPAKTVIHQGKTKGKLLYGKEKREFLNVLGRVVKTIYEHNPRQEDVRTLPQTPQGRKLSGWARAHEFGKGFYGASLKKVEFLCRALDGHQDMGPVWREVFRPVVEAERQELEWGGRLIKEVQEAFAPFKDKGRKYFRQEYTFDFFQDHIVWTKETSIMAALNTGNEGNLQALMYGAGTNWKRSKEPLAPEELNQILQETMTDEDWQLVRDIWRILDSMYPQMNDTYMILYGAPLKKVDGNYFPITVDRDLAWRIEKKSAEEEAKEYFHDVFGGTPAVKTGSIMERRGTKLAPRLEFNVIFKHITKNVHWATHAVAVRDVHRIVRDERFRQAIIETRGRDTYDQFNPWLRNVAMPRQEPLTKLEAIFRRLRNNTTTVFLGLKFTVSAKQFLSITQSMDELGTMPVLRALNKFFTATIKANLQGKMGWGEMADFVRERSVFMAQRRRNWDRELHALYRSMDPSKFGGSAQMRDAFFSLIGVVDAAATLPTWLAAYEVAIEKNEMTEDQAIEYADMVVRRTQPVASPKDLAAIQRGGELQKLVTMFYTFFSVFHNRMVEVHDKYRLGRMNPASLIKSYWLLLVLPAALAMIVSRRDIDDWKDVAKEILLYRIAGLPVIRDLATSVLTGFDYDISPVESMARTIPQLGREIMKFAPGGKKPDPERLAKYTIMTLGVLIGLPSRQAVITMEGLIDLMGGKTKDPSRLLYPKKKRKSR